LRKFLYSAKNIPTCKNNYDAFTLEYYITETEVSNENSAYKTYGIEIIKKQEINGIVYSEIKTIPGICSSENTVISMIKVIFDNTVTPITLGDIISDMLQDEKYSFTFKDLSLSAS